MEDEISHKKISPHATNLHLASTKQKVTFKDTNNHEVCSKYDQCIGTVQDINISNNEESLFTIPDELLKSEEPVSFYIEPHYPFSGENNDIDLIVNQNLREKKQSTINDKKLQESKEKARKEKLERLRNVAEEKRKSCPKKNLSEIKRNEWGHSIYNEEKEERKIDRKEEAVSEKVGKESIIKPIGERIKEYKEKERETINKHKSIEACTHKHINNDNERMTHKKIEQNAQQIMQEMKENKSKLEENKKTMKAKIRAIEIESKQSLSKFKKKPVDSTIEFRVDIDHYIDEKKTKKRNSIPSTTEEQNKKNSIKMNLENLAKFHQKPKKSKLNTQKSNKSKNDEQQHTQLENVQSEEEVDPMFQKFYFWNVPIHEDDYKKVSLDEEVKLENWKPKKETSFRNEVNKYLDDKLNESLQKERKVDKEKSFELLVAEKKKLFLSEFEGQDKQNKFRATDEVFWNEDELYKLHPISNF